MDQRILELELTGTILGIIGIQLLFGNNWINLYGDMMTFLWELTKYIAGFIVGISVFTGLYDQAGISNKVTELRFLAILSWFALIFVLLIKTHNLTTLFKGETVILVIVKFLVLIGVFSIIGSLLFFIVSSIWLGMYPILFGNFTVSIAIAIYLYSVNQNPENKFSLKTQFKFIERKGSLGMALFSYQPIGPKLELETGFDFLGENKEKLLMNLGLTSMVLLGRGEDYIEGSVILPVDPKGKITCLGVSFWVKDANQADKRFNDQTYYLVLISVKRNFDQIFENRSYWEKRIQEKIKPLIERKEFNPEIAKEFIETTIKEILLISNGLKGSS